MNRPEDDRVLSKQDLETLQRHLSMLSGSHVDDFYNQVHKECCLGNHGLVAVFPLLTTKRTRPLYRRDAESGTIYVGGTRN
jgi:hypothetical protein